MCRTPHNAWPARESSGASVDHLTLEWLSKHTIAGTTTLFYKRLALAAKGRLERSLVELLHSLTFVTLAFPSPSVSDLLTCLLYPTCRKTLCA